MPAVTHVVLYDDEAWPERVLAQEVVRLTVLWQSVEGEEHGQEAVELYLTADGRQRLAADLKRWRELGHKPQGKDVARRASPSSSRKEYRKRERDFADAHGLKNRTDGVHKAYETTTGAGSYYPAWLDRMFEAWEAAGSPPPESGQKAS
jgi:hypothetical protein